ncbi:acyclic terpene utilization AtuA family protein [Streptomyces sp. NBC_01335]|nr:acyclic terpene utilization AtuA family protein [Streptomyces sp. NBC_01335]
MTIPPVPSTSAQTPAAQTPAAVQTPAAQTPTAAPGSVDAPAALTLPVSIPVSVTEPTEPVADPARPHPLDPPAPTPLRIGNASGFYGDRFDAMREMLTGGPLDVLTGDYLAELTMLILGRSRLKDPSRGYATTFLRQLEEGLGLAVERGVKIVANAGGLNPAGLADAVRELADKLGIPVRVAHVEGDGRPVPEGFLTANAYLGGAGIAACLRAGADIVVTGRVTDAALVTGPAAAHFGWGPDDLDALAGAVVAGHVLECGTQATGGNYAFFGDHDVRRPGFPLAEIHADGSSVITKHPGTGGVVDLSTVTAQLLYETGGARYAGPDVTARLDTVRLAQEGPDRVAISGVRGEAPPPTLKVGLNRLGGWRNEVVFVLTGLDIEAKSLLVQEQFADALDRSGKPPAEVRWELARTDHPDAPTEETASALLRLVVRDQDPEAVGRAVSGAAVELALGSYPGFHVTAPPGKGAPYGVFEAAYVPASEVAHTAVLPDGTRQAMPAPAVTRVLDLVEPEVPLPPAPAPEVTRRVPLGLLAGARSGDKGGDANVGVWVRDDRAWRWLAHELTVERFRELLPETGGLDVERHVLPQLRAVNFVVRGLLGEGVAAQARFDPQAKALGEWLRSRHLAVPVSLLDPE